MATASRQGVIEVTPTRARPRAGRRTERDPESEIWSAFGYETMCLLWELPHRTFRELPEAEQRRLARLSLQIDDLPATEKDPLVRELWSYGPTERLGRMRRLAAKRASP